MLGLAAFDQLIDGGSREGPVSRDAAEADRREDVGARAAAADVGVNAAADHSVSVAVFAHVEIDVDGRQATPADLCSHGRASRR